MSQEFEPPPGSTAIPDTADTDISAAICGSPSRRSLILWFTGLPASGKSTLAGLLKQHLLEHNLDCVSLDGDDLRRGLCRDLGFSPADRTENNRRVAELASTIADTGSLVLVSLISPQRAHRALARQISHPHDFLEIFVDTPLEECIRRDPRGNYRAALKGELKDFTGIGAVYEPPEKPDLHLCTSGTHAADLSAALLSEVLRRLGQRRSRSA